MTPNSKTKKTAARKGKAAPLHYTAQVNALSKRLAHEESKDIYDTVLSGQIDTAHATAIYDLIRSGPPDFITQTLIDVLDRAAQSKKLPAPTFAEDETETAEQGIRKIADILLLAHGSGFKWRADPDSPAALAEAVAAILDNESTPAALSTYLSDTVQEWSNAYLDEVDSTAPFIETAFRAHMGVDLPAGRIQAPTFIRPQRPANFRRLAKNISAVLSDPNTPSEISSGILDGLAQIDNDAGVNERSEYVETILLQHAAGEKGGAK
jgi:hypothetical protein